MKRVRIARIGKPFGIKGEVTVEVFTDRPEERFAPGAQLFTEADPVSGERLLTLSEARRQGSRWTLNIEGVTDRNAAETLRGTVLFALQQSVDVGSEEDAWYPEQLLHLPVRDVGGTPHGTVVGIEHAPAHDLLVVRTPAGHLARVPLVHRIVPTITADSIVIDPPGGLMDPGSDD